MNYIDGANRFLSDDEGMSTEEILDASKVAFNKIVESNEFSDFASKFIQTEVDLESENVDEIVKAIKKEIWPRLSKEMHNLI